MRLTKDIKDRIVRNLYKVDHEPAIKDTEDKLNKTVFDYVMANIPPGLLAISKTESKDRVYECGCIKIAKDSDSKPLDFYPHVYGCNPEHVINKRLVSIDIIINKDLYDSIIKLKKRASSLMEEWKKAKTLLLTVFQTVTTDKKLKEAIDGIEDYFPGKLEKKLLPIKQYSMNDFKPGN